MSENWTKQELEASVEAYRRMQYLYSAGITPNKTEFFNLYKNGPLSNRSKGSFEQRMMNISHILEEQGKPSLAEDGYRPHEHVGKNVKETLKTLLRKSDEKEYPAKQICTRLGIDPELLGKQKGSSIDTKFFQEVCEYLQLDSSSKKQDSVRVVLEDAQIPYVDKECFSQGPKAGSTVRAHGIRLLHAAVEIFIQTQKSDVNRQRGSLPGTTPRETSGESRLLIEEAAIERNHKQNYERETQHTSISAKRTESELVQRYLGSLQEKGLKPIRNRVQPPEKSSLWSDTWVPERHHLIEAKGNTNRTNIRMAIGQLIDYKRYLIEKYEIKGEAILLPEKPDKDLMKLIEAADFACIWETSEGSGVFKDNKNGNFC